MFSAGAGVFFPEPEFFLPEPEPEVKNPEFAQHYLDWLQTSREILDIYSSAWKCHFSPSDMGFLTTQLS